MEFGEVNIMAYPISIQPGRWHQLGFRAETGAAPEMFYANFVARITTLPSRIRPLPSLLAADFYEAAIPSGVLGDSSERDIALILVGVPEKSIKITDLSLKEMVIRCR